jgi:hypothetical protein
MPGAGGDPGAVAVPVEIWGGLVTDMAAAALPHGVSPDCQDCKFSDGVIDIRPGLTSQYTLAGNPSVNYLKTYTNLSGTPRLLSLDSLGNLRVDANPGGALQIVSGALLPGLYGKSTSLFGREYIAFGNGLNGADLPRQYDDTNLDRISQVGPGQAPSAADELNVVNIAAGPAGAVAPPAVNIANSPAGAVQVGGLVTITLTAPLTPAQFPGDWVTLAGIGVAGYNGTFQIVSVLSPTQFTFANGSAALAASGGGTAASGQVLYTTTTPHGLLLGQSVTIAGVGVGGYNGTFGVNPQTATTFLVNSPVGAGLAASGGGTVTAIGNIPAGKHGVSVFFVTRNNAKGLAGLGGGGYWSKPAPPTYWQAGGGKRAVVTQIPVGGPNVIARVLCFTAAAGASYFHLGPLGTTIFSSNMYIADNTTTTVTVDFSDAVLLQGTLDDPLFNLIELPPVMGAIEYNDRCHFWGELNLLQSFLNLSFDGGFTNAGSNPASPSFALPNFPLGWTPDPVNSPGGAGAIQQGQPVIFGDAYVVVGNGATAVRGLITQGAAVDYLGNPILLPNTAYTVRARIGKNVILAQGTVHINLKSASLGTTVGISLTAAQLTQGYVLYTGNLTNAMAVVPADLVLQVYADNTPTANGAIFIDCIEILPTAQPVNGSNVRSSKSEDPESFDSQTGLQQVALNDGDSVRTGFRIRERLYWVKDNSFHATQADGVNEPASWAIDPISDKVGTPSVNGVGGAAAEGGGEDWVVIAHRTGLYIFWGGEPVKISQEIQPTWDTINWNFGWTISVTVDTKKRRILICAPFGAATAPNKTMVLDYHDVGGPDQIASSPPIHLTYTGRKTTFDKARKWCPWTIPANVVAQVKTANATTAVYFGSNDATGHINLLDDTVKNDNGAFIPQYYTTAGFVEQPIEQSLQLGPGRKLFTYLQLYATGSGTMGITAYLSSPAATAVALNPMTLSTPKTYDLEMMLNIAVERVFFKLSASGVNQSFALQKMAVAVKPDPTAPVAGAPGAPNVAA